MTLLDLVTAALIFLCIYALREWSLDRKQREVARLTQQHSAIEHQIELVLTEKSVVQQGISVPNPGGRA